MIARNPLLGRACDHLAPGLRRLEQRKHVIFYRLESDRVSIFRILHEQRTATSQLPRRLAIHPHPRYPSNYRPH